MTCRGLLVFLLVALLARDSFQRGTLFLNEIQAIEDAITGEQTLPIECTLWEDNLVYLDNFDSLFSPGIGAGSGVDVDGALLDLGTWVFPNDFNVAGTVTINGLLKVNGGFFADDGDVGDADGDDLDYAFEVQDDTGNSFISGELDINGSLTNAKPLTNPDGTFLVSKSTGETTISGTFFPNGGISVNGGAVTVASAGDTFASGSGSIAGDLILGTDIAEVSELIPFTNGPGSVPTVGGDTTLKGQDAADAGGNIVLSSGEGIGASDIQQTGDIVFGLESTSHPLTIGRFDATAGNAGKLHFGGQAASGDGGDIVLRGGDAFGNGRGGNVIFSVGQSSVYNGVLGNDGFLYLGDPADGSNIPFYISRPDLTNSNRAGHTFITGQNFTTGTGGDTFIVAGDGSIAGGNVHLEPGMNENRQGKVFFGSPNPGQTTLNLIRPIDTSPLNAGATWFIGQDSTGGDGGDLYLEGGRGAATINGRLFLSPGTSNAGTTQGTIFWGTNEGNPELRIVRPVSVDSPAHDTTFLGASSTATGGGDLILAGGNGLSGGDIHLEAGFGEEDYGGEVVIQGGEGNVGGGGGVSIRSGVSAARVTGHISITAGDGAFGHDAGSVFISSIGSTVTVTSGELLLDSVPFFVDKNGVAADFRIEDRQATNVLLLSPNAPGLFRFTPNGLPQQNLLGDRHQLNSFYRPVTSPYSDIVVAAQQFQAALSELRDALQDQHNLIQMA
mmetsp:Transcript_133943/g.199200  ORF Transcript_133943/g.199200 Transcript_133943/m.199200 type:complete len:727 (-) Transcript_133943:33-2213(-)